MKMIAALLLLLVVNISLALVDIQIQGDGLPLPTFFSGTNARLSVAAISVNEEGDPVGIGQGTICEMFVWLGPHLIDHWERGPRPASTGRHPKFMFDSTTFPSGSIVEVTVFVYEASGPPTTLTESCEVKNTVPFLVHPDMAVPSSNFGIDGIIWAQPLFNPKFQTTANEIGTTWNESVAVTAAEQSTVYLVSTHGRAESPEYKRFNPGNHVPGSGFFNRVYALPPPTPEIASPVENSIGTGTPPFQSGRPVTNLAFINSCESAKEVNGVFDEFAKAFLWPYLNFYAAFPEDQAFVGTDGNIQYIMARPACRQFFADLLAGLTVGEAMENLQQIYNEIIAQYNSTNDPNTPDEQYVNYVLVGDEYMRLVGVYTGDAIAYPTWYRGLQ